MGDGCIKDCKCEYETTGKIPTDAAKDACNEKYGTSCKTAWDGVKDTKYYKDDTTCPTTKKCEKGCHFLHLEWCYVHRYCRSKKSYPTALKGTTAKLAYSYEMCSNAYCWDDFKVWGSDCPDTTKCPAADGTSGSKGP